MKQTKVVNQLKTNPTVNLKMNAFHTLPEDLMEDNMSMFSYASGEQTDMVNLDLYAMEQDQDEYEVLSDSTSGHIIEAGGVRGGKVSKRAAQTVTVSSAQIAAASRPGRKAKVADEQLSPQELDRRNRRRARNREAAQRQRQRRNENVAKLETEVSNLKSENTSLQSENDLLKEELKQLRFKVKMNNSSGRLARPAQSVAVPVVSARQNAPRYVTSASKLPALDGNVFKMELPDYEVVQQQVPHQQMVRMNVTSQHLQQQNTSQQNVCDVPDELFTPRGTFILEASAKQEPIFDFPALGNEMKRDLDSGFNNCSNHVIALL